MWTAAAASRTLCIYQSRRIGKFRLVSQPSVNRFAEFSAPSHKPPDALFVEDDKSRDGYISLEEFLDSARHEVQYPYQIESPYTTSCVFH